MLSLLAIVRCPKHQALLRNPRTLRAPRGQDAKDAWYGAGGAANKDSFGSFVDATGASGRNVGQELDMEAIWSPRKDTTLQAGFSVFLPGKFVKNLSGTDDQQFWEFVSFQRKF